VPSRAPQRAKYQLNLANVLADLGDHGGDRTEVARASRLYRASGRRGLLIAPETALAAALSWSEWATVRQAWRQVVEAGEIGAEATSSLLAAQVLRAYQESWIRDAQELLARHAWALIRLRRATAAAVAVESRRALLLSEALQRDHRHVEELAEAGHPELAQRFWQSAERVEAIRRRVESAGARAGGAAQ